MLKKRSHNHYFNQTNPNPQPKPKNKPQKTTRKNAFSQKTLTTTTKTKLVRYAGYPCRFFLPRPPNLQLPTWKKGVYFYNNNQTNWKLQPKSEINLKKHPEKMLGHTGQIKNNQRERTDTANGLRLYFYIVF